MVKFISFLALSTLIIAPTFASALWDLETRDVSEPHLLGRELNEAEAAVFARDMQTLFARQFNPEHVDLDSRANGDENTVSVPDSAHRRHAPLTKHELVDNVRRDFDVDLVDREFDDELLERNLDYELYVRDLMEADLFDRFYDDLD